jgi:cobalamin biosynthesis Mg chelatase CobN
MADRTRSGRRPERPLVIRTIVVLAVVVVLAGVVWASMLGHLF